MKTDKTAKSEQLQKASIKAGRIVKVKNTLRPKFSNANHVYYAVWVEDSNGRNERCFLLTSKELERLEHRSLKNKEDWTKKGFFTNLFD